MTTVAAPGGPGTARHRTLDERLEVAFGASLLIFLVVGDAWFPTGSPWHRLRLPALGAMVLTAGLLAIRRPSPLRLLVRPPMVCFLAFSVAALAVAPVADAPRSALRFAVGYLVIAAVAVIAGGVFAPRTLVRGALASLLMKVGISLAIAGVSDRLVGARSQVPRDARQPQPDGNHGGTRLPAPRAPRLV